MPLLFHSEQRSDVCVRLKNRSEHEACNFVSNLCNLDSGNASPLGFVMVKWAGIVLAPGGIELARGRIEVLLGKNRSLLWFYPEFTTLYHKILKNDPLFETNQISRVFLLWLPFSDAHFLSKNSVKKWGIGNSFFKALFLTEEEVMPKRAWLPKRESPSYRNERRRSYRKERHKSKTNPRQIQSPFEMTVIYSHSEMAALPLISKRASRRINPQSIHNKSIFLSKW